MPRSTPVNRRSSGAGNSTDTGNTAEHSNSGESHPLSRRRWGSKWEQPAGKAVEEWANDLLEAVERGSAAKLLDLLAEILRSEPRHCATVQEQEQLELLQSVAGQMRIDLYTMLLHVYQRLEASRTYLDVVHHLAQRDTQGRASAAGHPGLGEPGTSTERLRWHR